MLFDAIQFAITAHAGQQRKFTGAPYIQHPLRVMSRTLLLPNVTEESAAAAVLHDVIEDCNVTQRTLEERFGPVVATLVEELTNVSKIQHPEANREQRKRLDRQRIATISPIAKRIKLIDRIDNLRDIPPGEGFRKTYIPESRLLLDVLRGTDPALEAELESLLT
jgi:(p)ppGpp synthase/HD superfamily hydrolase